MGRSSNRHAANNRAKILIAASDLIKQKGLKGASVRELMASAGLSHGAFASQFGSKEVLAGEACDLTFEGAALAWAKTAEGDADNRVQRLAEYYFSSKPPEHDCPMAALCVDARHSPADGPFRRAFTRGLHRLARIISGDVPTANHLALFAAMVGAAALRRACDDERLADEIEHAVLQFSRSVT